MEPIMFQLTEEQRVKAATQIAEFQDEEGEPREVPERFIGVAIIEDEETTDGRFIEPGALSWRELPLPLLMPNDFGGHGTDRIAGRVETLERVGNELRMAGAFDLEGEVGREGARLVAAQLLRWVSADVEIIDADMVETDDCVEIDGERYCEWKFVLKEGRIMGITLVPFPAFPGAVIVPEGVEIPAATEDGRPVVTAAAGVRKDFFSDPQFAELQKWTTVTDEGRIMGHLFGWGECHAGYLNTCLTPDALMEATNLERSNNIGSVRLEDGTIIGTAPLCIKGHSTDDMDFKRASQWMDDPRNCGADVVYGKDKHGVWFSGAIRPTTTPEQIHILRASGVSGEWHWDNGERVLLGACVNVPGYAKAKAQIRAGEVVAACLSFQEPDPTLTEKFSYSTVDGNGITFYANAPAPFIGGHHTDFVSPAPVNLVKAGDSVFIANPTIDPSKFAAPLVGPVPQETLDRITALETELAEIRLEGLAKTFEGV